MMVVMSLIFSTMFKHNIEKYPIYYLTGQTIWTLFSTATNSSMMALVDNKSLLIKAKLPKQTFILSRIYTALVNFGYTSIAYLLMIAVFRIPLKLSALLIFIDVLYILIFSMGVGYILSVEYVFFADIKYLYGIFLTLLMYLSAIFYPVERLSDEMKIVIGNNPIYLMIYFARQSVMYGKVPDRHTWIGLSVWCVGVFLIGWIIFKMRENKVMQVV